MSDSILEHIQRLRNDRQMIQERQKERNQIFQNSTQNFLKSINREIDIIKKTQIASDTRNQEFQDQIQSLYLRYETGTERLRMSMQRTMTEKINYNTYLIKVYPKEFLEQKRAIEEENEQLRKKIQYLKENNNAFDYRLQQALNQQQGNTIPDVKQKLDKYKEELKLKDHPYVEHPEYQPYNYHGTQFQQEDDQYQTPEYEQHISEPYQNRLHGNYDKSEKFYNQDEEYDQLEQFLHPVGYKKK